MSPSPARCRPRSSGWKRSGRPARSRRWSWTRACRQRRTWPGCAPAAIRGSRCSAAGRRARTARRTRRSPRGQVQAWRVDSEGDETHLGHGGGNASRRRVRRCTRGWRAAGLRLGRLIATGSGWASKGRAAQLATSGSSPTASIRRASAGSVLRTSHTQWGPERVGQRRTRVWSQQRCIRRTRRCGVVFRIILHDDFRIISDANLVIIQIVSCRRELGARGLTEAAGSGKFPSGGTDDSDLFCFAADLQLNRGLDGSAVGWQGVVRSGTVFCRSRLRGLAGPVGSGVGIAVAGRSSL